MKGIFRYLKNSTLDLKRVSIATLSISGSKLCCQAVKPHWATFERSWKQIFLQKLLKYLTTIFGLLLKMLLLKNAANILGQLFGVNIGLLFSLTSGHTGRLIPDTRINTF